MRRLMTSSTGTRPERGERSGDPTGTQPSRPSAAPALGTLLRELQGDLLRVGPNQLRPLVELQLGRLAMLLGAGRVALWSDDEGFGTGLRASHVWPEDPSGVVPGRPFPIPVADLAAGSPAVVLGGQAERLLGAREAVAVPVVVGGRLVRVLTVAWDDGAPASPVELDPTAFDLVSALAAALHGALRSAGRSEQAGFDEQTGLANRPLVSFMAGHLLNRLGRGGRGGVAVILCTLDAVPSSEAVTGIARSVRAVTRGTDVVGRFDERTLAVLCDDLRDPGLAVVVARRLAVACAAGAPGRQRPPTFGIGYTDEAVDPAVLLRRAELAAYQARGDGAGAVRLVGS